MENFDKPILFLFFKRTDTAKRVFLEICNVKPTKLYLAADGPRFDHSEEKEQCEFLRTSILSLIDWPCEVKTLFRDNNLGCGRAVSSAIDWFFENESEGIILEDDCLPGPDFFRFTSEMLDRYRYDSNIMHISGNFFQKDKIDEADYYFSHIPHIWGWATWRRAWCQFDYDMVELPEFLKNKKLKNLFPEFINQEQWRYFLELMYLKKSDTWDTQWGFALFKNKGLAINPNTNLVSNLGFGVNASHSVVASSPWANMSIGSLSNPLVHPSIIKVNAKADYYTNRHHYNFGWMKLLLLKIGLFKYAQRFYLYLKRLFL